MELKRDVAEVRAQGWQGPRPPRGLRQGWDSVTAGTPSRLGLGSTVEVKMIGCWLRPPRPRLPGRLHC